MYVASFATGQILRFNGATGAFVDVFVPAGSGGLGDPNDVTFGSDGHLYVTDGFSGTNSVLRYDGSTGDFIGVFASGGGMMQPNRLTFGPDGNLFVGNATTSEVLRYHGTTGAPEPSAGNGGAIFVPGQAGPFNTTIAFSPLGDLFVVSGDTAGEVRRYDGETAAFIGPFTTVGTFVGDIAFGPDGDLYVAKFLDSSVLRFDGSTGASKGSFVAPGGGGLSRPTGLTFGPTEAGCDNGGWINFGFSSQSDCVDFVQNPPQVPDVQIYLSSTSSGTVDGIAFDDEDILAFAVKTNEWSMFLDGSDVGIGSGDVDAFTIVSGGPTVVVDLSFERPRLIAGVGWVDDSDVVTFTGTPGPDTSGSFELLIDGSDVQLTGAGEDIDALARRGSNLVFSTRSNSKVAGISAKDEDLWSFLPTSTGSSTAGTFELLFDGSDVLFSYEDVSGVSVDPVSGDLYLASSVSYSVADLAGDRDDVLRFVPTSLGSETAGSYSVLFDGDDHGFGSEVIDGLHVAP